MTVLTCFSGGAVMGLDFKKVACECRLRAAEYKKKAERVLFHSDRRYFADMAQQWFVIAQGYEAHLVRREVPNAAFVQRKRQGMS
jgi:hypothetical protein